MCLHSTVVCEQVGKNRKKELITASHNLSALSRGRRKKAELHLYQSLATNAGVDQLSW